MLIITGITVSLISYLLGCASASILLSRFIFNRDVRSCGSGNAGATNMARSFGMLPGVATLVFDVGKAVLAVLIGKRFLGEWGLLAAGSACLTGHCFPVFYRFKGGKGVSVCAALMFFIDPRIGAIALSVFFSVSFTSRKVSLASMLSSVSVFILSLVFKVPIQGRLLAALCMLFVLVRHKENIERLIKGTEPDFRPHR